MDSLYNRSTFLYVQSLRKREAFETGVAYNSQTIMTSKNILIREYTQHFTFFTYIHWK